MAAKKAPAKKMSDPKPKPKNSNKPGPMDDIGRAAALVKRGIIKNPSNPNGYSNLDKALGRNDTRSITKMPGDIARGLDFLVRKATPLPDRKKIAPKKKK
jgi:hypothetical protein